MTIHVEAEVEIAREVTACVSSNADSSPTLQHTVTRSSLDPRSSMRRRCRHKHRAHATLDHLRAIWMAVAFAMAGLLHAEDVHASGSVAEVGSADEVGTADEASAFDEARALYLKGDAAFREGDDVIARRYYRQSLEVAESLEALCSLGRVEARSKLFAEAYEHLRLCVVIFPDAEDREPMKANYAKLRDRVRQEITFEQAHPIDERIDKEIQRRRTAEENDEQGQVVPASGLDEPPQEVADTKADRASKKKWAPAYVLGGVTVATFGTSMVFRALAGTERKRIEEFGVGRDNSYCLDPGREGCAEQAGRIERQGDYATVSNGTLLAAGIGAAATLGYTIYVLAKKPKKEPSVRTGFSLSPAGGAIAASGTF